MVGPGHGQQRSGINSVGGQGRFRLRAGERQSLLVVILEPLEVALQLSGSGVGYGLGVVLGDSGLGASCLNLHQPGRHFVILPVALVPRRRKTDVHGAHVREYGVALAVH